MRCDKANGWVAMREFLQSHQDEAVVQLRAPSAQDAKDYECSGAAPWVRLVRCISSTGQVRVMATNLPAQDFPASVFGDLYHQRWRIEEAFKRLKHRLQLESVSGLTQQALLVDVAAKVLAHNLAALVCMAVQTQRQLQPDERVATVRMRRLCCSAGSLVRCCPARRFAGAAGVYCRGHCAAGKELGAPRAGPISAQTHAAVKPHPHMAYKG